MKYLVYRCPNHHLKLCTETEAAKEIRVGFIANCNVHHDDRYICGETMELLGTVDLLPFVPTRKVSA